MILRPIRAEDAPLLLRWRNDAATRANSRSTEVVGEAEHMAWLRDIDADPANRRLYLAEVDGQPVGTGRIDRWPGTTTAELSLTIAPEARGRRLAAQLIDCLTVEAIKLGYDRYVATVRRHNTRSLRAFLAAGFVPSPVLLQLEKT